MNRIMRCFGCGYTLWNLSEPRCPECGLAFDLRDYRFEPGKVAFACGECGHHHGGTGEYGHPTDKDTCVCRGCGKLIETASMQVLLLSDGGEAEPARLTPWERRGQLGFWRGWWRTTPMSLFQPGRLGDSIGPWTWAPRAAWFTGINTIMPAALFVLLSGLVLLAPSLYPGAARSALAVCTTIANTLWSMAGLTIVLGATGQLVAVVAHNVLVLTGSRRGGMRVTNAAISYGYGPIVLAALPVLGLPVAMVWICASSIVVLSRAQQVSPGRAALAVLCLPGAALLLILLLQLV